MAKPLVRVEGLNEFRRTLRSMDKNLPKELSKELKTAAEMLVEPAREKLPVRSGKLRESLQVMRGTGKTAIGSYLPYAMFVYWGGTTGRGHELGRGRGAVRLQRNDHAINGQVIKAANPAVHQAAAEHEQELLREFERAFQTFAGRNGWH